MDERRDLINNELQAQQANNPNATAPLEFRGDKMYLPLIKIDTNHLILNHKNNRLTGQLEDHPKKEFILQNPNTHESQEVLIGLLRKTEKYVELREQLRELGQKEPGLITRDGLVVNGNTRIAALKEIGINHIEVAVMPENTQETDVFAAELKLQVEDLVHQDYTFTNQLLMMNKFIINGGSPKDLAKELAWSRRGETKVNSHLRYLSYIEEVRNLSSPKLPYKVFDDKKEHLKNLDEAYMSLKGRGDIEDAETLKWSRLTFLILGISKDQVRTIDESFIEEILIPRLKNDQNHNSVELFEKFRTDKIEDNLDDIFLEEIEPSIDMKKFLNNLLTDKDLRDSEEQLSVHENEKIKEITFVTRRTTEKLIDDKKLESLKSAPVETLKDIRAKLVDLKLKVNDSINSDNNLKKNFKHHFELVKKEINTITNMLD